MTLDRASADHAAGGGRVSDSDMEQNPESCTLEAVDGILRIDFTINGKRSWLKFANDALEQIADTTRRAIGQRDAKGGR